jgi:hypothetical protein
MYAGFEVVHGLLDHVMTLMDVKLDAKDGYSLVPAKGVLLVDLHVYERAQKPRHVSILSSAGAV